MIFPNKLFSYNESVISKFPIILEIVEEQPITVSALYLRVSDRVSGAGEFIEALDALYALNAIDYDDNKGALVYANVI